MEKPPVQVEELKTIKPNKLNEEIFCEYLAHLTVKQKNIFSSSKEELNNSSKEKPIYDPPYTLDQIKANYPENIYVKLANDPIHRWRAETGIELIHKEPTEEELEQRITEQLDREAEEAIRFEIEKSKKAVKE